MTTRTQMLSSLLVAVVLFVSLNIVTNGVLTSQRLDLTENRLYTLSDGSRNILKHLEDPITLRFYYSAKQFASIPEFQNYGKRVRDLLQEYVAAANGKIVLQVIEPEPFSDAEDQAVGYGIEQLPINATGEVGYLGLVGTNMTDKEAPIAFLNPERADALEYEITKLIYALANPKKRSVGVISDLSIMGGKPDERGNPAPAWTSIHMLQEFFDLKTLPRDLSTIDADIDTLLVVHPKDLPKQTLYAIDQFVLRGGKALVFVDPLAEEDRPEPDPRNPMVMPKTDSNLAPLFEAWGVSFATDKVVADAEAAVRVNFNSERGPNEVQYLPWLMLHGDRINHDDFITNHLQGVNVGSAGMLEPAKDAKTTFTPLLRTGPVSGLLEREAIVVVRDPNALHDGFKGDRSALTVAARVSGPAKTAFPEGPPAPPASDDAQAASQPAPAEQIKEAKDGINVIVVADTDVLADRFWVRMERFLGMQVPNPFANNADFLINAVDNLGGNDDLISLRSRGEYARPFEVVERIKRDAESQFREREKALQAKLKDTEAKLKELRQRPESGGESLLSPEQRKEMEMFRKEQLATRKELRTVQHELGRNIEQLGTWLKAINIGLVPLLVALLAFLTSVLRQRRSA